jgi:hypothetical protein
MFIKHEYQTLILNPDIKRYEIVSPIMQRSQL